MINSSQVVYGGSRGSPDHALDTSEEQNNTFLDEEESDYDSEKERQSVLQKSLTPITGVENDEILLSKMGKANSRSPPNLKETPRFSFKKSKVIGK